MSESGEPYRPWEEEAIEYWLVWKPFVGVPGVCAWWWTGGAVGLSPWEYLDHAFAVYERGRRDYLARNPSAPRARQYGPCRSPR